MLDIYRLYNVNKQMMTETLSLFHGYFYDMVFKQCLRKFWLRNFYESFQTDAPWVMHSK